MLEVNPELTRRDVQGILATTSRVPGFPSKHDGDTGVVDEETSEQDGAPSAIGPADTVTNPAGFMHSYDFGTGLVDTHATVTVAKGWVSYGDEVFVTASKTDRVVICDDPTAPALSANDVVADGIDTDALETECVDVLVEFSHASRGDLEIILALPRGTVSRLTPGNRNENADSADPLYLSTVHTRGESPFGEWTLQIKDVSEGDHVPCQEGPWTPPPLENGCAIIDSYSDGCDGFDDDFPTTPDRNGQTAADAYCACGGGAGNDDGDCANEQWQFDFGDESCYIFRDLGQCALPSTSEDFLDTALVDGDLTARKACCICDDGFKQDESDLLIAVAFIAMAVEVLALPIVCQLSVNCLVVVESSYVAESNRKVLSSPSQELHEGDRPCLNMVQVASHLEG